MRPSQGNKDNFGGTGNVRNRNSDFGNTGIKAIKSVNKKERTGTRFTLYSDRDLMKVIIIHFSDKLHPEVKNCP